MVWLFGGVYNVVLEDERVALWEEGDATKFESVKWFFSSDLEERSSSLNSPLRSSSKF